MGQARHDVEAGESGAEALGVGGGASRTVEAFKAWVDRNRRWLLIGVIALHVLAFNGQWRIGKDTALYVGIGRSLAAGEGFVHGRGLEGRANPGLPYLVAASYRIFGERTLWPVVLLMSLAGLAILGLTYRLFLLHADRPTAVIVTVLLGITASFFKNTLEVLTDIPFMLGLMLMLVGYESLLRRTRVWLSAAMMAVGIALMAAFKLTVLVPVAALVITLAIHALRSGHRWRYVAGLAVIVVALASIRLMDPRSAEGEFLQPKEREILHKLGPGLGETLHRTATFCLPDLLLDTAPEAAFGIKFGHWIITGAVGVLVLAVGVSVIRYRLLWGVMVAGFIAQWLLFLPGTRYMLPVLPLIIFGWWGATQWLCVRVGERRAWLVLTVMLGLWGVNNLGRSVSYVYDQRHVPFYDHLHSGRFEKLPAMGAWIDATLPAGAVVVTRGEWVAALQHFADRRALSQRSLDQAEPTSGEVYLLGPPDEPLREAMEARGWRVADPLEEIEREHHSKPLVLRRVLPAAPRE